MRTFITMKLLNKFNVSIIYQTKTGIKSFHQVISNDTFKCYGSTNVQLIDANNLTLWIDNLRDKYTNINSSVYNSPHFDLVTKLIQNVRLNGCEYLNRVQKGRLDFRKPQKITNEFIEEFKKDIFDIYDQVKEGTCEPIKIVKRGNINYIADGKHRASLYAFLGRQVPCIDITPAISDSFFWWVYRLMLKEEKEYSKHISYFKSVLNG
jgi:hypothetical protein